MAEKPDYEKFQAVGLNNYLDFQRDVLFTAKAQRTQRFKKHLCVLRVSAVKNNLISWVY